ncbi:hypothetical protein PA01_04220 [Azoarcus sp. PA01]|nr:hypothetical protein PA01_04220 [Azoarcus sp. PA01]
MHDAPQSNSVEQRRKLLKGALAASGVVTMGYSGSALASINCVEQVRTDMGFPGTDLQFRDTNHGNTVPVATGSQDWAWVKVEIFPYTGTVNGIPGTTFEGFQAVPDSGAVYTATQPVMLVPDASLVMPVSAPRDGFVLAYFDDAGEITGVFPTTTTVEEGFTPATDRCLASINPGLDRTNMLFGG